MRGQNHTVCGAVLTSAGGMTRNVIRWAWVALLVFFAGCSGTMRGCSSMAAQEFGGDWVVVQYTMSGEVLHCWELHEVSVANEESSDGIYWLSPDGHLVHISNMYNRVQVEGGRWAEAYEDLGVSRSECVR